MKSFIIALLLTTPLCVFAEKTVVIEQPGGTGQSAEMNQKNMLEIVSTQCPWIKPEEVSFTSIFSQADIGRGGDFMGGLGKLGSLIGNKLQIGLAIPANTRAFFLDLHYHANNLSTQIVIEQLILKDFEENSTRITTNQVLKQANREDRRPFGETLLICFGSKESFKSLNLTASHRNLKGAVPTLGIQGVMSNRNNIQPPR